MTPSSARLLCAWVILGGWSKDEGSVPGASLQASLTESSQCLCEGSVYHPLYRSRNELREEVLSGPISLDSPILQAGFRTLTLPLSWLKGFLTQGSAPTHSLNAMIKVLTGADQLADRC